MSRHATDRWDWTIIVECPNNGEHIEGKTDPDDPEHLTIESEATNSKFKAREAIPIEECPVCGAELDYVVEQEPHEVLTDGGTVEDVSERTAPNACETYDGEIHCEQDNCEDLAEWRVEFHTGGSEFFNCFACDDHVAEYWGYHPNENRSIDTEEQLFRRIQDHRNVIEDIQTVRDNLDELEKLVRRLEWLELGGRGHVDPKKVERLCEGIEGAMPFIQDGILDLTEGEEQRGEQS